MMDRQRQGVEVLEHAGQIFHITARTCYRLQFEGRNLSSRCAAEGRFVLHRVMLPDLEGAELLCAACAAQVATGKITPCALMRFHTRASSSKLALCAYNPEHEAFEVVGTFCQPAEHCSDIAWVKLTNVIGSICVPSDPRHPLG